MLMVLLDRQSWDAARVFVDVAWGGLHAGMGRYSWSARRKEGQRRDIKGEITPVTRSSNRGEESFIPPGRPVTA